MISAENVDFKNSIEQQYLWLEQQGFEVVERKEVTSSNMEETVKYFAEKNQRIRLSFRWFGFNV